MRNATVVTNSTRFFKKLCKSGLIEQILQVSTGLNIQSSTISYIREGQGVGLGQRGGELRLVGGMALSPNISHIFINAVV